MKFTPNIPPRPFTAGRKPVVIHDCARIELAADEQVTLTTAQGAEYDLVRKAWGFYATPSLNGRLREFGLRAVLVKNTAGKFYVLLVETGHERAFDEYLAEEAQTVVAWLDDQASLDAIDQATRAQR